MIKIVFSILALYVFSTFTFADENLENEAVKLLQAYLKIDTISPPGNESRAVDFLAEIFDQEGIQYDSAESAPGRGNIWARIKGGDKPALILLHHSDRHFLASWLPVATPIFP